MGTITLLFGGMPAATPTTTAVLDDLVALLGGRVPSYQPHEGELNLEEV